MGSKREGPGSRSELPNAAGLKIAIVASRFNPHIVDGLLAGAEDALRRMGAASSDCAIVRTPGAFELPLAVQRVAAGKRYDGVIALGCVIRGETAHFEFIAREASAGIARVALDFSIPVGFGVLTVDNDEQAAARSGAGPENKGFEAAVTVVEMIQTLRKIGSSR
jgi:6,7-dimethyl-8-ribityllumazine synthase